MAGDAADGAAAASAGAADKDVGEFGFHTPRPDCFGGFAEWKSKSAVKDVAAVMAEFLFDVERCFGFETGLAVVSAGEAIFNRFSEITVEAIETISRGLLARGVVVCVE